LQERGDPAKPGAGRPRKIPALEELIADIMGDADGEAAASGIREVFEALRKRAIKGDVAAAKILIEYTYGKAAQSIKITEQPEKPIKLSWCADDI